MTIEEIDSLSNLVKPLLRNNEDYLYVANFPYKHTIFSNNNNIDREKNPDEYLDFVIRTIALTLPSTVIAKHFAHFVIAVLTGVAAADILMTKDIDEQHKFTIMSQPYKFGFKDTPENGNVYLRSLAMAMLLSNTDIPSAPKYGMIEMSFKYLESDRYNYLDLPIELVLRANNFTVKIGTTIRDLNNRTLQNRLLS